MPCKPRELLALAKSLQASKGSEAFERCAVSRAYYAALHEVDATFIQRAEFRIDGESSHREIISRATVYGNSLNPGRTEAGQVAQIMTRLRRARNKADYELEKAFSPKEAEEVLSRAEFVLNLCDTVCTKIDAAGAQQA